VRVGVVELEPVDRDLVGNRVRTVRGLAASLECRSRRDYLGGAARLEYVGDRGVGVASGGCGGAFSLPRLCGHSEHLTRSRLHDDGHTAIRLDLLDLRRTSVFGLPLQVRQNGQAQIAPRHGRDHLAACGRDRLAARSQLHHLATIAPGQK